MSRGNESLSNSHTILIVSGGSGASGEQLAHTVLAQFPGSRVQVVTIPNLRFENHIDDVIERAQASGATVIYTLVDAMLRHYLTAQAQIRGVAAIDVMGALIERLEQVLGRPPAGQPGLYRQLNKAYFDRVAAIEYTMAHDDGKNPDGWAQAEIVLAGVSRAGKTPLSLYLSVLGWKVANVPLVPGLALAPQLFQLDPQRVFGLKVDAGQLLAHRQQRQQRLGVSGPSDYVQPEIVLEELEYAMQIFKRGGFKMIDVTDKPIESCADEVIRLMTRRAGSLNSRG